jgi:cell fate (sporulation/competence/biofilm development) regulator YmcA (YheA/YmcA/DUF963 family)
MVVGTWPSSWDDDIHVDKERRVKNVSIIIEKVDGTVESIPIITNGSGWMNDLPDFAKSIFDDVEKRMAEIEKE